MFVNRNVGQIKYVIEIEKNIGIPLSLGVVYAYYEYSNRRRVEEFPRLTQFKIMYSVDIAINQ